MLPELDKPSILDVGCGSGIPTMELARLSNGQVTGVDISESLLDRLSEESKKAGLSDRVKTLKCSMFDMDFPDESFDIIWAEGSIAAIGFERGLKEWRRFLKSNGFLAVHDDEGNITEKLEQISSCDYDLLGYFTLHEDTWWTEYYSLLEKQIREIRTKHIDDPEILVELDNDQRFIDTFKKNPEQYGSVFFTMKKR